jgi:kumamolisin
MSRVKMFVAGVGVTAVLAGSMAVGSNGLAEAAPNAAETVLAGSAVPFASPTAATGVVAGSERLTIQLWLTPQILAAQRFALAVSTPGNSLFHHYLSPAGYTSRFGAGPAEANRVESWLRAQGFSAIQTDSQRSYVRATATVSTIDRVGHSAGLRQYDWSRHA